jgi:dihydrofolate synthase/folylpolyglutamate synthase
MSVKNLDEWLNWQSSLHPREIELGLTRCRTVAQCLNLLPLPFPSISVAGTNGKGSSVILLDSILSAANYRIGRFTSPHLLRYNERICVAGIEASNNQICEAFERIEAVRNEISLTYFEFSTLAALLIFQQQQVDLAILEVGLGGRLDSVNIIDSDIALITAIDIDHIDWLGKDRETIGFEKAGIFRTHHPAVCSDVNPPQSLIQHAEQLQTPLSYLGRDFNYIKKQPNAKTWIWQSQTTTYELPLPRLQGDYQLQNAAGVLQVLELLKNHSFSVPESAISQGLTNAELLGRFQILSGGRVTQILDVAHNPLGAKVLTDLLSQSPCQGKTHALVGMLKDKDIAAVFRIMKKTITHWHIACLKVQRSASLAYLVEHLNNIGVDDENINTYSSITEAYKYLLASVSETDRIIVFGSFHTIQEVLQL